MYPQKIIPKKSIHLFLKLEKISSQETSDTWMNIAVIGPEDIDRKLVVATTAPRVNLAVKDFANPRTRYAGATNVPTTTPNRIGCDMVF